jgi:hypothetical protein
LHALGLHALRRIRKYVWKSNSNMLFPSRLGRTPATRLRREKAARRSAEAQLDQLRIRRRLAHELNERKAAIPGILDALVVKAQEGDVPAARELRGWRGWMSAPMQT